MLRCKKIWYQAQCWVTEAKLLVAQTAFLENGAIGIEIDVRSCTTFMVEPDWRALVFIKNQGAEA